MKFKALLILSALALCGCADTQADIEEAAPTSSETAVYESPQASVGEKSTLDISENEYVTIAVNSVSDTGAEITIYNTSDITIEFGTWFAIEAQRDGEYYELVQIQPPNGEEWAWTDELYSLSGGEEFAQPIDWEKYYGYLPSGSYRIIKSFSSPDLRDEEFPNMKAEDFYAACEFTVA